MESGSLPHIKDWECNYEGLLTYGKSKEKK